jgi:hypothetical protein
MKGADSPRPSGEKTMNATPLLTSIALAGLLAAPIAHAQLGVVGQVGGTATGTLQGGLDAGPRMIDQRALVDGTQTLRGRLEAQRRAERERPLRNAALPALDAAGAAEAPAGSPVRPSRR